MATRFDPEQKERFVHNLVLGLAPIKAVSAIGITRAPLTAVNSLLNDPYVLELLQAYKEELEKRLHVDRDKLTSMAMDTFDVAKVQSDARGMIQVVKELADIHGMHTPQEIRVTKTTEIGVKVINAVSQLPEDELLRLAGPLEGSILEAEFVVLEEK